MLAKLGTAIIATAIGLAVLPGATTVTAATTPAPVPVAADVSTGATGIACTSTRNCAPLLHGGAYMVTTVNSCSAGLPVRSRATGAWYVLTAGHCVARAGRSTWRQSNRTLGVGTSWEYAGLGTKGKAGSSDLGLIKVTGAGWSLRSRVLVVGSRGTRSQQIIVAKDARTGERVCVTAGRSNITRCGTVVQSTTSLRYASPGLAARTVGNLALVKGVCLQPGDSGSAVFAGRAAIGIAVAKSGSGCYFWYAKVPTALARYGVAVVA